jgi:hypothetical protein
VRVGGLFTISAMEAIDKSAHGRVLPDHSGHELQNTRAGSALGGRRTPALTPALPCSEAVRRRVPAGRSSVVTRSLPSGLSGRNLGQGRREGKQQGRSQGRPVWIIHGRSALAHGESSMILCLNRPIQTDGGPCCAREHPGDCRRLRCEVDHGRRV